MKQNRKLIELRNIGKKIAGRLNEVEILSEDELREIDPVGAHKMIKEPVVLPFWRAYAGR